MKTDKIYLLIENQNLRKMLEVMREDISKNCVDCKNRMPYLLRYVPENLALAHMKEALRKDKIRRVTEITFCVDETPGTRQFVYTKGNIRATVTDF